MGPSHRIQWIFALLLIAALAAGCRAAEPGTPAAPPQSQRVIQWDRSPTNIVFQADVVGGSEDISRLSDVPRCTIYGDNRVVWVNELDAFHTEVLYDMLTDTTIESFVTYLTVQERIYTYQALASEQQTQGIAPVVETVFINVNQQAHSADAFSGWDSDWFSRVLRSCQRLSQAPILFEPDGGWLTTVRAAYNTEAPIITWDAHDTTLNLAAAASGDQPGWISGGDVMTLWNYLNTLPSSLLFSENSQYYRIALQLPGISRTSPPAP
jgi:hypothetical protein